MAKYPREIALVYRHWPLSYHQMAYPAARAAECAAAQGRFSAMHDALYASQDSLTRASMLDLASQAGITDRLRFTECFGSSEPVAAIERDIATAQNINGIGTPTIVINGRVLKHVPDSAGFDTLVRDAIAAGHQN